MYRKPTTPKGFNSPDTSLIPHQNNSTIAITAIRPIAEYEKRVSLINESLRHVTFKQEKSLADIVHHLKEQNVLLLRLCNDLTEELVTVQRKKGELKAKCDSGGVHHSAV